MNFQAFKGFPFLLFRIAQHCFITSFPEYTWPDIILLQTKGINET